MPRPRHHAEHANATSFSVTPWQTKRSSVNGHQTPNNDAGSALARSQPSTANEPVQHSFSTSPSAELGQDARGAPTAAQTGTTTPSPSPPHSPSDSSQSGPPPDEQQLLRQASFEGLDLPPVQPSRKRITHGPLGDTLPVAVTTRSPPVEAGPQAHPTRATAVEEASAPAGWSLQGTCQLAVLPGRVAYSGHLVDARSRACIGVMGHKVSLAGDDVGGGDLCGMDDDEELIRVTLIPLPGHRTARDAAGADAAPALLGDVLTYVVSTGGDLPRWRAAMEEHLLRYGVDNAPPTGLQVRFDGSVLCGGPSAEAQLARFARKLCGSGADVVTGEMCVTSSAL